MNRPKIASIKIHWIDELGDEQCLYFNEDELETAHDLIGLMIGEISEGDLQS